MDSLIKRPFAAPISLMLLLSAIVAGGANGSEITSKTIHAVLREPLPAEELSVSNNAGGFVINGPTFAYSVDKASGAINSFRVVCDGQEVITTSGPADIQIDQYRLASTLNTCKLTLVSQGKDKVVLEASGVLRDPEKHGPEVDYTLAHTFFNDGVVVSKVRLIPRSDLLVRSALRYQVAAKGQFSSYLHKRRDEHGDRAVRGKLPESGQAVRWSSLTSCLGVFSLDAGLAVFTDAGAVHQSQKSLDTATAEVIGREGPRAEVSLAQYLVHVAPGDQPWLLKGGEEFAFRVGISLAPNRLPHPRIHDLRMFTWIGDAKYPYPTDEEIASVAQWGYTVFQMHRLGNPGEPRPPAGELERVIAKVHQMGMLFLWEENADLLLACAPGVQELRAKGQWSLWQGFNYGGRYTAKMDPYMDTLATCLASPNGLAEYRLANLDRMVNRFAVDGIYLDDNLAYPNCTLWKEHGHPQPVYDCLIELHEMNWRRRELLRRKCPHALLLSHCSRGFVLPVIADFDAQLYGEGYSFASPENYWDNYVAAVRNLPAQGMIWPGDDEPTRCASALAYNYDLLTGGGQYTQLDWRLFPKKFSYAAGVTPIELLYSKTYNLAQYYFGMYEAKPFYFANSTNCFTTKARQTYATLYHNQLWDDWLIVIANMNPKAQKTALEFHSTQTFGIAPAKEYLAFDIHRRTARALKGDSLNQAFNEVTVPGENLNLYLLRPRPANAPFHVWGGKRISEVWDAQQRKLTFEVHGPAGLQDTIFIAAAQHPVQQVLVAGEKAAFSFDPVQGLAHGLVTFTTQPVKIEVICSPDHATDLPEQPVSPTPLALQSGYAEAQGAAESPEYEWARIQAKAPFAPRDGAGALTFQRKMWLIGGWNPSAKEQFPRTCGNDVWNSTDGLNWSLIKPNTFLDGTFDPQKDWEGRHTAGYVVFQDKMWLVGGDPIQKHYQSDVWDSTDGKSWNLVNAGKPVPWGPRVLQYTVAFKDRIWIMGGQTVPQFAAAEECFYRDIWNTSDGVRWEKITPKEPCWTPRGLVGGSVVFKDRIWILGGGTYDTPKVPQRKFYNDVWSSRDGVEWICHLESAPWSPREYHDVAVFDNRMWVLEGYFEKGGNRKDVWHSQDGIHWEELPNTPWTPRHAASIFVHDNALWVVAGNNMESDVWKLTRRAKKP
jgi:hypothetical protein